MDERLLTPADVAERCQISAKSVLRAIHRGQLRAYRLGERGAYRLRECDVDAWLEQTIVGAAGRESRRRRSAPCPRAAAPGGPADGSRRTWAARATAARPERKGSTFTRAPYRCLGGAPTRRAR